MKNAILLAMVGVGTAIVVWESRCRANRCKRREIEQRVEVGRWESEGGAVPQPEPRAPGQEMRSAPNTSQPASL